MVMLASVIDVQFGGAGGAGCISARASVVNDRANAFPRSGRLMNSSADALVAPAAADVGHGFIDVLVGGLGLAFEQRCGGQYLT